MPGIKDAKCILVVGATAGIGRALALALHDLDSKPTVVVAGRRQERLDELAKRSDRIKTARVDINTTYDKLKEFVEDAVAKYPDVGRMHLQAPILGLNPIRTVGRHHPVVGHTTRLRLHQARDH